MAIIMFNGKTYNSVDDMPEVEKRAYIEMMDMFTDKNGNGIPDFLEGDMVKNVLRMHSIKMGAEDGVYHSIDELPPDLRLKVEDAFQKLSKLGILSGMSSTSRSFESQVSSQPMADSRPYVPPNYNTTPMIQEEKGTSPLVWIMIGGLLVLCVLAVGFGIFLFTAQ